MIRALLYLQSVSIKNGVRRALRRLRQPRYAIATVVAIGYFYLFFFRPLGRGYHAGPPGHLTPPQVGLFIGVAMIVLLMVGRLAYAWIFSADRAAVTFTEAEVAFLFPAPVTRSALVHFKLLKSQLRILIYAVLLGLLMGRSSFIGGNAWTHAVGWWILFSILELHGIAASFTRERLLHLGLNPVRRRLALGGGLAAAVLLLWWGVRRTVPAPTPADLAGLPSIVHYVRAVLAVPAVGWALAPFRWVIGPFFAPAGAAFWHALGPALAMLVLHYFWVIRSEVAFEEASIEVARRNAERISAMRRGGRWRGLRGPARRRREPFPLRPRGLAPVAFLWRNLIAAGPWFYPRTWLWIAAGLLAGMTWMASRPAFLPWMLLVQKAAIPVGAWVLIFVPMFMRRQLQLLFERLDVIKTHPLRGWQVVLGETLAPVLVITAVEWLLLSAAAVATGAVSRDLAHTSLLTGIGAFEIGLLVPPVAGLMLAIPFGATLYFPGWMSTVNQTRGIDTMGQRLIFAAGFLLTLAVALIPAALGAAVPYFLVEAISGVETAALLAGSIAAGVVLVAEFAVVIWWLGRRYERFDLSVELPQT